MLGKHFSTITAVILVAIVIGYLYERYKPNNNPVIEKSVYVDISQIDDLKPFLLVENEYDKAIKQTKKLREDFLAKRFDEIESFLASINNQSAPWDLSSLTRFYLRRLKENSSTVDFDIDIANANQWIEHSPNSEFAYVFRAHIYHIKGWNVRGNKFANKTSRKKFIGMEQYFRLAVADYQQALKINQKNDYAWSSLVSLSKTSSKLGLSFHDLLESSDDKLPGSYFIKFRYLNRLQPKWGGSFSEMFRFVRAQNVKEFPELAMLVAQAHEYKADHYANNKGSSIVDTALSLNWVDVIRLVFEALFEDIFNAGKLQKNIFGIDVGNDSYWERYGEYFANEEIWDEYSKAYQAVFSVNTNFTQGLHRYANAARQSKRLSIADKYFDKAVLSGHNFLNVEQIYYIARFQHVENENVDKAIKFYNLYLELDSDYNDIEKAAYSADVITWYYGKKAAYQKSFNASEIAYKLKPDDKRIVANHCNAFFNVHRYSGGIPYCMESLEIDPDYAWPHYVLYETYQRLGDSEKSAYYHEKYKKLLQ